jgi:hypothetical protein
VKSKDNRTSGRRGPFSLPLSVAKVMFRSATRQELMSQKVLFSKAIQVADNQIKHEDANAGMGRKVPANCLKAKSILKAST